MAGGGVLLGAGCGGDDPEPPPEAATAPPESEVEPTPTQAAIASPVPGYPNREKWIGRGLAVATQGGAYGDAQAEAMLDAFAAATGAAVKRELLGDLGELRQQVENEAVVWDVVDVPTEEVLPLARADYLLPIDYQVVDRTPLMEELAMQFGVGAAVFATVLAFPASLQPRPTGWADFWDVESLPGGRTLRRRPVGTLEFALLADGVPLADLYPLDVPRAFAKLDALRPHVVQWYDNANQPVALLGSGDAVMAATFNVGAGEDDTATDIDLEWRGGMLSGDSWVVPRGSENADVAMDFINFATRAVPTANLSRLVPFGPVNLDALALLRPDRVALMPNTPDRRAVQFVQGWNWWADNRDDLSDAFEDWLQTDPEPTSTSEAVST